VKGDEDTEQVTDKIKKAHAAAALYLALMQLPGARSHIFNEFTFRSVVQTVPLIVAAPRDEATGKKRRHPSSGGGGLSRAQRKEGTRKSSRATTSSTASKRGDDDFEDMDLESDDETADISGSPRGSGAHDKEEEGQRALGMNVLRHARLLAERLSLQTVPQAHEQLARVTIETALSLPSSTPEAELAWGSARALARPLHGPGAGKCVLKQLLPGVLRPSAPAAAVKAVVAFVDSCLAELPPPAACSSAAPLELAANNVEGDKLDAVRDSCQAVEHSGSANKKKKDADVDQFEDAVMVLCHQLCVRVGDRAPTRVQVAIAVGGLLDSLRARRGAENARLYFENMGRFLSRLARHAKPALRLFACELAGVLLFRQADKPATASSSSSVAEDIAQEASASASDDQNPEGMRMRLLRTLFKRCSDKLPSVRAKALSGIATAFQHEATARQVVLGLGAAAWAATSDNTANLSMTVNQSALNNSIINASLNQSARAEGTDGINLSADAGAQGVSMLADDADDLLADVEGVWEVVRRRCDDPKSFVRKGAVQVLEARLRVLLHSTHTDMPPVDARDVTALLKRCQDPSVLVRKQALDALTSLTSQGMGAHGTSLANLARRGGWDVVVGWVKSAVPMVRDREPSVADRAFDAVALLLLMPMADNSVAGKELPNITRAIMSLFADESRAHLQFACRTLGRKKPSGLPNGLTKRLMARLSAAMDGSDVGDGKSVDVMWWVLEEVAALQPTGLDHDALLRAFRSGSDTHAGAALRTATRVAALGSVPEKAAGELFGELVSRMHEPTAAPTLLHDMVKAAAQLARSLPAITTAAASKDWAVKILETCDTRMAPLVAARLRSQAELDSVNSSLDHSLASEERALSSPTMGELGKRDSKEDMNTLIRSVFLVGALALEGTKVHTRLSNAVQALLAPASVGQAVLPVMSTTPPIAARAGAEMHAKGGKGAKRDKGSEEQELQGHVLVALGKLALQDASLANKVSSLFLREVEYSTSPVQRNNLLIILTDICVRYTSLVDPHINKLALCLRDDNLVVRKHALTLITNLLASDYVKWRGTLFFRYLVTLVDNEPSLAAQARQSLFRVLLPKSNFLVCYSHFVESIFVLNEHNGHTIYNTFSNCPATERTRFSLAGREHADQRRTIYRLLLLQCSDEQRFQITAKLCEDILGGVADDSMRLVESEDVLSDALYVLASKEIKLSAVQRYNKAVTGEDDLPDDDDVLAGGKDAAVKAAAKVSSRIPISSCPPCVMISLRPCLHVSACVPVSSCHPCVLIPLRRCLDVSASLSLRVYLHPRLFAFLSPRVLCDCLILILNLLPPCESFVCVRQGPVAIVCGLRDSAACLCEWRRATLAALLGCQATPDV